MEGSTDERETEVRMLARGVKAGWRRHRHTNTNEANRLIAPSSGDVDACFLEENTRDTRDTVYGTDEYWSRSSSSPI